MGIVFPNFSPMVTITWVILGKLFPNLWLTGIGGRQASYRIHGREYEPGRVPNQTILVGKTFPIFP